MEAAIDGRAVLCLLFAACGCGGGGEYGGDGQSFGDDDGGGAADLAPSYHFVGWVGARNDRLAHSFSAFADFPVGESICPLTAIVGPCRFFECPAMERPATGSLSAGEITIRGGATPVLLAPDPDSTYPPVTDPARLLWGGGEPLTFRAAGWGVPSFTATITGPEQVTFTAPQTPPATIVRSRDLRFAWSPTAHGTVELNFNSPGSGTTTASLVCEFPSTAGMATVPAAALSRLGAGQGTHNAWCKSEQTPIVGDWSIGVRADEFVAAADGSDYSLAVSYQ